MPVTDQIDQHIARMNDALAIIQSAADGWEYYGISNAETIRLMVSVVQGNLRQLHQIASTIHSEVVIS